MLGNARMCNAILDTPIYNGHTTAVDALWAGVPVITMNDATEMSSRVGASILTAIGVTELITTNMNDYKDLGLQLGLDKVFYKSIRNKLIDSCLAKNPRNPYWDIHRYK